MEAVAIEGINEGTNKEFKSINAKMIGLISKYQYKFEDLQWKNHDILASIKFNAKFKE